MGFRGHHCPLQCLTDLDPDVQRQEVSHCTTPLWKEECGGIYVPTQFKASHVHHVIKNVKPRTERPYMVQRRRKLQNHSIMQPCEKGRSRSTLSSLRC